MPINQVKKVVGYARVSSESQKDNTSIKEQVKRISAYCISQGFSLVNVFKDEAKSASSTESREEYLKMLEFAKEKGNEIDAIIVYKADRIHRHLKNLLIMIEDELKVNDIAFISVSENFDTSTPQGMLTLQMLGSFAEFERSLINERTRTGRLITAKEGKYAGGKVPYGYEVVDGKFIIIEPQAKLVKSIFRMYSEGKSYEYIANYLNISQTHLLDNSDSLGCHFKKWSRTSICYILLNSAYIGTYTYNGKKEKNNIQSNSSIPDIISKKLFNKVQSLRQSKSRITS